MKPTKVKTKDGEILKQKRKSLNEERNSTLERYMATKRFGANNIIKRKKDIRRKEENYENTKNINTKKKNHILNFLKRNSLKNNVSYMEETIIAFVLRKSPEYDIDYVKHIIESIKRNLKIKVTFVCLSDIDVSNYCTWLKFQHNWAGWWSKLELFSHPYLRGKKVIYFDLDVIVLRDITDLITYNHDFTILKGFSSKAPVNSSIMAWSGDKSFITAKFDYEKHSKEFTKPFKWGDQDFIYLSLNKRVQFFQDIFPSYIVSKKMDKLDLNKNRIVCFHGKPRPRDVGWKV